MNPDDQRPPGVYPDGVVLDKYGRRLVIPHPEPREPAVPTLEHPLSPTRILTDQEHAVWDVRQVASAKGVTDAELDEWARYQHNRPGIGALAEPTLRALLDRWAKPGGVERWRQRLQRERAKRDSLKWQVMTPGEGRR
jgi:hypothetical protein